jgi:hypothetical protein
MRSFTRLWLCILTPALTGLACQSTQPPQTALPPAVSGTLLFQDDFANPASGWDRLQAVEGIMDYDAGGYRILVNALQTNFWATPHKLYTDVRVEVDAGKLGGPEENRVGLICRRWDSNYYFFLITHDGYYGIGQFLNGQATLIGRSEMAFSPAIHTGVNINHLRADCVGNTLTLFVNGQQIEQVGAADDGSFAQGEVGLLAGTFGQPGVDMFFDNFVVIQP